MAGGTYIIGALWLSRYRPETGAVEAIIDLLGSRAAAGLMALAFLLLLFVNPLLAMLITSILENYPAVVAPYILNIFIGFGIAYLLRRPSLPAKIGTSVGAMALLCLLIWAGTQIPMVIEGAINFELAGVGFMSIQSSAAWITIILIMVYATTLHSPASGSLPRAYTTTLMLILMLVVMIAAIFITNQELVAPAYTSIKSLPLPVPLLFITLTGGAVCGFYALLAGGGSPRKSPGEENKWG